MSTRINNRIYIDDFCEDLNYQGIILYISENVNVEHLRETLNVSHVNKIYRLEYALNKKDPAMKNFIYVENCDLQDLDFPVYEYVNGEYDDYASYDIYTLYEDAGKFYIKSRNL